MSKTSPKRRKKTVETIAQALENAQNNIKIDDETGEYKVSISVENIDKAELLKELLETKQSCNMAYWERTQFILFLSKRYPSWREKHNLERDPHWLEDWADIIYIEAEGKQMSWHIHKEEMHYFSHLELRETDSWDGHNTIEKYDRLRSL